MVLVHGRRPVVGWVAAHHGVTDSSVKQRGRLWQRELLKRLRIPWALVVWYANAEPSSLPLLAGDACVGPATPWRAADGCRTVGHGAKDLVRTAVNRRAAEIFGVCPEFAKQ